MVLVSVFVAKILGVLSIIVRTVLDNVNVMASSCLDTCDLLPGVLVTVYS